MTKLIGIVDGGFIKRVGKAATNGGVNLYSSSGARSRDLRSHGRGLVYGCTKVLDLIGCSDKAV